jgi:hypothetical protein
VRLSPLGTSATNWPIVPAPDDRWWRMWSSRCFANWQGKPMYSEKTCPSATLSTKNPTWPDLGSNQGRGGGKPSTNGLSYGTAIIRANLQVPKLRHLLLRLTCMQKRGSVTAVFYSEAFGLTWFLDTIAGKRNRLYAIYSKEAKTCRLDLTHSISLCL